MQNYSCNTAELQTGQYTKLPQKTKIFCSFAAIQCAQVAVHSGKIFQ